MPKENINVRIDSKDKKFMQDLVSAGTFSSVADVVRKAIRELRATYTNEPTPTALDRQLQVLKRRVDKHDEIFREMRRQLDQDGQGF